MTITNTEAVSERPDHLLHAQLANNAALAIRYVAGDVEYWKIRSEVHKVLDEAADRRGGNSAGGVEVERFEPFADQDDGEFKGMGAVPDGDWVRYSDWAVACAAYRAAHAEVVRLSSLAVEADPVALDGGDGITDEMLNAGQSRLCEIRSRTDFDDDAQAEIYKAMRAKDPLYTHPSSPVSAEVTEAVREAHYREFMADKGHGPDGRTTRQALADALDAALAALNGKA
jgi:hypothetical protein